MDSAISTDTDATLRAVGEDELTIAVTLLTELFNELGDESDSVKGLSTDLLKKLIASGNTSFYFIMSKEIVEGIISLSTAQSAYAGGEYGLIDEMYIRPHSRSKGLGSIIIRRIEDLGREKGLKRIDVTAPSDDTWQDTVRFYKSCGFNYSGPKLKIVL